MAGITSLGVGSGQNLGGLLEQLQASEQTRLTPLTNQKTDFAGQITAFGIFKTSIDKLNTATTALAKSNDIVGTTVSSKNTAFSITTAGKAIAGDYSIEVGQLAQAHSLISRDFTTASDKLGTVSSGNGRTLVITQTGEKKPLEIKLTDNQTSLEGIRDAINKAEGSVNASIIKVSDKEGSEQYRLMLTAKNTGTESKMTIRVDGDSTLNNILNYTPGDDSGAGHYGTDTGMKQQVIAKDAKFALNGIDISRQSNTISDALDGVTFTLQATTEANKPEKLNITRDSAAMQKAIQDWVEAYNSLQTTIESQTKYVPVDAGSTTQNTSNGALLGNSTVRGIQTQLKRQLATPQVDSGDLKVLNDLGIKQNGTTGKLEIDTAKLQKVLKEQPENTKALFVGDGKKTGFATQTSNYLKDVLDSKEGMIQTAKEGLESSVKKLDLQIKRVTNSINDNIARYKTQFSQLDKLVSGLTSTGNALASQFNALNSL
ncbi:flagellar filament capping protein FliD [Pectobacterium aquaticum]|uniref:flagellar filament capping protein FliD n=1 Tax=Pectobacterium aquaticum TaxID=2204145 RepID=UPI001F101809|nr:flagellar filament capping protein FliD [Pectobacterium aquaticum]MCH5052352.1 flagellar filament capping protein FliD [Pectobacterium aquaticum]